MALYGRPPTESYADVWVIKEYGVKDSWTKLLIVPKVWGEFGFDSLKLCFTKDGDVVIALNSNKLVVYKPEQNSYLTSSLTYHLEGCFHL